jgi:hypothetical protein
MIVWLASYPRSGNTLLRTLLHQTLGLKSLPECTEWRLFPAEADDPQTEVQRLIGTQRPSRPWEEFYPAAVRSGQCHLVKTHQAPVDDQPAIYVLRDGRKAAYSYWQYHRAFLPAYGRTLLQVIAGEDYFGDWSSHYRAWTGRARGSLLVLRYEELVHATAEVVGRIAAFLSHPDSPKPWVNPFEKLREMAPRFFREGPTDWEPPPEWTPAVAWAFAAMHGSLMDELGYGTAVPGGPSGLSPAEIRAMAASLLALLENPRVRQPAIRRTERDLAQVRARLYAGLSAAEHGRTREVQHDL